MYWWLDESQVSFRESTGIAMTGPIPETDYDGIAGTLICKGAYLRARAHRPSTGCPAPGVEGRGIDALHDHVDESANRASDDAPVSDGEAVADQPFNGVAKPEAVEALPRIGESSRSRQRGGLLPVLPAVRKRRQRAEGVVSVEAVRGSDARGVRQRGDDDAGSELSPFGELEDWEVLKLLAKPDKPYIRPYPEKEWDTEAVEADIAQRELDDRMKRARRKAGL